MLDIYDDMFDEFMIYPTAGARCAYVSLSSYGVMSGMVYEYIANLGWQRIPDWRPYLDVSGVKWERLT